MLFEVEKKAPKQNPTTAQLSTSIMKLRSYGRSSFASLTDEHGNYLQVAGGGITCLLERNMPQMRNIFEHIWRHQASYIRTVLSSHSMVAK